MHRLRFRQAPNLELPLTHQKWNSKMQTKNLQPRAKNKVQYSIHLIFWNVWTTEQIDLWWAVIWRTYVSHFKKILKLKLNCKLSSIIAIVPPSTICFKSFFNQTINWISIGLKIMEFWEWHHSRALILSQMRSKPLSMGKKTPQISWTWF